MKTLLKHTLRLVVGVAIVSALCSVIIAAFSLAMYLLLLPHVLEGIFIALVVIVLLVGSYFTGASVLSRDS